MISMPPAVLGLVTWLSPWWGQPWKPPLSWWLVSVLVGLVIAQFLAWREEWEKYHAELSRNALPEFKGNVSLTSCQKTPYEDQLRKGADLIVVVSLVNRGPIPCALAGIEAQAMSRSGVQIQAHRECRRDLRYEHNAGDKLEVFFHFEGINPDELDLKSAVFSILDILGGTHELDHNL